MNNSQKLALVNVNGKPQSIVIGAKLSSVLSVNMPCGGHGKCGKCKVIASGALSALSETEQKYLTEQEITQGVRLACCVYIEGDCSVTTKTTADHGQIMTDGRMSLDSLNPTFSKYGVAIDIGTTTLAAQMFDTDGKMLGNASRLNPQSIWGADVISRIEASMRGESARMAEVICGALDELIETLANGASIPTQEIDGVVVTGNTAMLHLLMNTSTEPLSHAPFAAERLFGEIGTASEIGLRSVLPQTEIYLPSCISAFVGADTICALLSTQLCQSSDTNLMVDIGTNGEMGLWHNGQLYVCSTAAGPAFEGVGISMGMSGAAGAIDRVSAENGELDVHVIGDVEPRGICGSGLVDAVAALLKTEVLDESGYLEDDIAVIAEPVSLTQQDIRMVQLAKSAINAGIKTLMKSAGLRSDEIAVMYVAGGFGSYLDMNSAGEIGLIPSELVDRIEVVGNAALSGAAMLLLNSDCRIVCEDLAKKAQVLELSSNPVFADEYMTGMLF